LISNEWHYAFVEAGDGTIWIGSVNGLSRSIGRQEDGLLQFQPVAKFVVQSLAEDIAGNIWIGTESSGTYRLSRSGFRSFEEKDGLKTLRGLSITNGAEGNLYFVTNDAPVIHRFDGEKISAVSPLGMTPGSWGWNQYHFQDHTGEWWIAGGNGLQRYSKVKRLEDLAHTRPKHVYTVKDGLPDDLIFRLFEDSRGDIWIGTLGALPHNLARWDRATETFHAYTDKDGVPSANGPTAFAEDRHGNIWIGYYNSGPIIRFRNGRFETPFGKDGLRSGLIRDMYADTAGRLWIGSASGGVFRIDEPNSDQPGYVALTTIQGLSSNQVTCITEDNFKRIYLGTGRGVNRLDTSTGRIKLFTTADGLAENYVNVCERDKNGGLWFGFYRGLSRFVPEPEVLIRPPSIVIANVFVNGVPARKLSELGEMSVKDFQFQSDQRQIRIEFFSLGFAAGDILRYQYKFEGGNDWSEPTVERTVSLNLSPGSYRFLVRAVNADGLTSEQPAAVSFTILRPVWQRWWFLTLALLTMTGIVYALYRFRLAQLLKVERVRTRIATDLHDDIGASLSRMAILSEVVKQQTVGGNGKQAAPLLTEIADSARGLVDSLGDIVWSIDPRRDDLQSVVRRIRQFASDVLEAKGIDWELHVPPEVESLKLSAEQRQHLFLIFKEGINNVVRHGKGTKSVSLSIRIEGRELIGQISDDGCGFTPQEPDKARSQGRGGNGLPNMRERAGQLGGHLEITSAPSAGTKLTLRTQIK
jgi:signal transduction histidine kinase/streptogramin lyase